MQWFFTLVERFAAVIFAWLGPLAVISGLITILGGALAAYQSRIPQSPWYAKQVAPWGIMAIGFVLVGLPNFLNLIGEDLGTTGTFAAGAAISPYGAVNATSWASMSPVETLIAALGAFKYFWAAAGAGVCYFAIQSLAGVLKGTRRGTWKGPVAQLIAGSLVIRLPQVAESIFKLLPKG